MGRIQSLTTSIHKIIIFAWFLIFILKQKPTLTNINNILSINWLKAKYKIRNLALNNLRNAGGHQFNGYSENH